MKIPSMLPLLSSPLTYIFFPRFFFFKSSGPWGICLPINTSTSDLTSRYAHWSGTLSSQGLSLPRPRLHARCSRSHGLAQAGGFLWRWDLRLQRPSIRAGSSARHPILSASFDTCWKAQRRRPHLEHRSSIHAACCSVCGWCINTCKLCTTAHRRRSKTFFRTPR